MGRPFWTLAAALLAFPFIVRAAVPVVPDGPKSTKAARLLALALTHSGVDATVTDAHDILACLAVDATTPGPCLTTAARGPVVLVGSASVGQRVAVTVDAFAPPEGQRIAEDTWKGPSAALPDALGKLAGPLAKKLSALPPSAQALKTPDAEPQTEEVPSERMPAKEPTATLTPPRTDAPRADEPKLVPAPRAESLVPARSNTASYVAMGVAGAAAAAAIGLGISTAIDSARLSADTNGESELSYSEAQAIAARANATLGAAIGAGVAAVACAALAWILWESP